MGDNMMKKLLLLLLMILIINLMIYDKKGNRVETVFNETNGLESIGIKSYTLEVANLNITTKNISSFLNNIDTRNMIVYPSINKIYEAKLYGFENGYQFISSDINTDINKFTSYYTNVIKKNGLYKESELISINGIKIKTIIINLSIKEINTLKYQYSKLIYY